VLLRDRGEELGVTEPRLTGAQVGFEGLPKMFQGPTRYVPAVDDATVHGLVYPRRSVVLVAGVPGAGKSTLLRRLFGLRENEERTVLTAGGVRVVDSLQSRRRLGPLLGRIPYPLWRWVVQVLHGVRMAAALRGGPVVLHECGTRRTVRVLIALFCRLRRYEMHVVMIDATPREARNGQNARGRLVTERSHRVHSRRWRRLRAATRHGPAAFAPGVRSLLALDRHRAQELAWIRFGSCADTRGPLHTVVEPPLRFELVMSDT
jgi:energy-coupling factor transporter ATP-binding protein EcfA2